MDCVIALARIILSGIGELTGGMYPERGGRWSVGA